MTQLQGQRTPPCGKWAILDIHVHQHSSRVRNCSCLPLGLCPGWIHGTWCTYTNPGVPTPTFVGDSYFVSLETLATPKACGPLLTLFGTHRGAWVGAPAVIVVVRGSIPHWAKKQVMTLNWGGAIATKTSIYDNIGVDQLEIFVYWEQDLTLQKAAGYVYIHSNSVVVLDIHTHYSNTT